MQLSRCWGIPYCELVDRMDFEELIRQKAFDELCPLPDSWMQNCLLLEALDFSTKPLPAYKRYPGDIFKDHKQTINQTNRKQQLMKATQAINALQK